MKLKMCQIQLYITVKIISPSELSNMLLVQLKDELGDFRYRCFWVFLEPRSVLDECFFKRGPQTNKPRGKDNRWEKVRLKREKKIEKQNI